MQGWIEINLVVGGGWPPNLLDSMSLKEYARWYQLAGDVNERQQAAMKG